MNKKKFINICKYFGLIILGNILYSFGIMVFIKPHGLITGGITGLSLFFNYEFGWDLAVVVGIFNVIFFIVGFIFMGKKFALTTLASSIIYPICIAVFELLNLSYFHLEDLWLNVICGGLIIGTGLGIIMKSGASTGGMDIPAIIINKYIKHISVGVLLLFLDVVIMIVQLPTAGLEKFIFGAVLAVVYSFAIDKVMLSGKTKVQLLVNSIKQEEIKNAILHDMDRGVTLIHGKTGYLKHRVDLVLSILDIRQLAKTKALILSIDPDAFIIVSQVSEVNGRGFSKDKVYEKEVCDTKNVLFIGDSKASVDFTGSMLDEVFANFNVNLLRDTIPGSTILSFEDNGVIDHIKTRIYDAMNRDVDQIDYIIIQRNCNDLYWSQYPETSLKVGDCNSESLLELFGAIKFTMDYFSKLCPKAQIIFTTSTYRIDVDKKVIDDFNTNLKKVVVPYPNVHIMDLNQLCGVNEGNWQEYYLEDGVHQNEAGVELWKTCYTKYFETILK